MMIFGIIANGSALTTNSTGAITAYDTNFASTGTNAGGQAFTVEFFFSNGSNAGTLALRGKVDSGNIVVKTGSYCWIE